MFILCNLLQFKFVMLIMYIMFTFKLIVQLFTNYKSGIVYFVFNLVDLQTDLHSDCQ